MTVINSIRVVAFLMAGAAVVDPSCVQQRRAPVAVDVRGDSAFHDRLARELGSTVDFDSAQKPAALVIAGGAIDAESIPAGIPVSTIRTDGAVPNVSVLEVRTPAVLRPGWSAEISVLVQGKGMAGKSTAVALEEQGVEIAAKEHAWTKNDETVELGLAYVPSGAGLREFRTVARPNQGEIST